MNLPRLTTAREYVVFIGLNYSSVKVLARRIVNIALS